MKNDAVFNNKMMVVGGGEREEKKSLKFHFFSLSSD